MTLFYSEDDGRRCFDEIYGTVFGYPVYINENQSPGKRRVLNAAKDASKVKHFELFWIRCGKIRMRKMNGSSVKVVSMDDVKSL